MSDDLLNQLDQVQEDVDVETEETTTEKKRSKAYPDRAKKLKKLLEQEDGEEPKKVGRPATGVKRSVFSASLDNNLIKEINELAKLTGLSKTALTEKAFELFMEEQADFYREMLGKK